MRIPSKAEGVDGCVNAALHGVLDLFLDCRPNKKTATCKCCGEKVSGGAGLTRPYLWGKGKARPGRVSFCRPCDEKIRAAFDEKVRSFETVPADGHGVSHDQKVQRSLERKRRDRQRHKRRG